MGGGNGCKSAAKREKNAAKAAKAKKGAAPSKPQAMQVCKRCFTQFPMTAREPELQSHCENKHPDFKFAMAFPDYGKEIK